MSILSDPSKCIIIDLLPYFKIIMHHRPWHSADNYNCNLSSQTVLTLLLLSQQISHMEWESRADSAKCERLGKR